MIPPAPTQRADRFGVYNWNVNDSAFPTDGSIDRLNWAANKVAEMGSRTIRVAISPRDDYHVIPPGVTDLVQVARSPAYDKLFRDARFQTYLLTTYTFSDNSSWGDGYTDSEYAAERDEIKSFGEYLLGNPAFANKTFIILNWEGDNAIAGGANKRSVWNYYIDWIRARVDGVKLARQNFPDSDARLFSGLEFSAVRSPKTGQPCGAPVADPVRTDPLQNRCLIDYVAPLVEVDYYSYSSWQSVIDRHDFPNESLKQRYKSDLSFALSKVKARRPEITEQNFIIGEYGFERSRFGECNAANHLNELFDAFDGDDAFHVSYAIFWQIIDNGRIYGLLDERFGLFRASNGQLAPTLLSETFRKRIADQQVMSYTGCPRIRRPPEPWGVVNQQGAYDFSLNPDSLISIHAPTCCQGSESQFSALGNKVHFSQIVRGGELSRDNAPLWSESPTRINFSIPPARRPGQAWIYVTDARGIDSNAQTITLSCADCPRINAACGVVNEADPALPVAPGSVISINGDRFSSSGNTVVIELLQPGQVTTSRPLPRENILFESPTQINVKLPDDLPLTYQAIIYVVNHKGLESRETVIGISPPCLDCTPRFRPCRGIVNEAGGGFVAGTVATAFGRFSTDGNKLVIEQVDQQYRVYQHTVTQGAEQWSEASNRIRFALPDTLFPGRALIHISDAQGRDTSAREIIINATQLRNVSSANYRGPNLAAESIASAFGQAMASITQSASSTPLPTEMAGTRVIVRDNTGVERPAPLFFISPTQINYQIPPGTLPGSAAITVINGSGLSSTDSIQIVSVAPGLFSANATGGGVAAALALRVKPDGTRNYEAVAEYDQTQKQYIAVPIDLRAPADQVFLVLFGTGLRGRNELSGVTVIVGGADAEVTYAGPQAMLVGLDQINLRLPSSLSGKGEADVTVIVDGIPANTVKVRIK
ncbi:MAG: hypothetical protein ACREAB_04805 [Blastocatellia bacterium]